MTLQNLLCLEKELISPVDYEKKIIVQQLTEKLTEFMLNKDNNIFGDLSWIPYCTRGLSRRNYIYKSLYEYIMANYMY